MKNGVNRILSNEELIEKIEEQFEMEDYTDGMFYVLVFEETGAMTVSLYFDDEYLEAEILNVENDMIALQKEIKEIGKLIFEKYNIIPEIKMELFDGLKPEYIYISR